MKKITQYVLFAIFFASSVGCGKITDDFLITKFKEKKSIFSRLENLAREYPEIHNLTKNRTEPENSGIAGEKLSEYRELLNDAGIKEGLLRRFGYTGITFYITKASGLPSGGYMLGYAYCVTVPSPVLNRIDFDHQNERGIVFRKIEGHWYVFYSVEG